MLTHEINMCLCTTRLHQHRDLKPGNLLVTKSCQLRITDFGLARERPLGRGADPDEEVKSKRKTLLPLILLFVSVSTGYDAAAQHSAVADFNAQHESLLCHCSV
jgi:serine/threonine protein kinase